MVISGRFSKDLFDCAFLMNTGDHLRGRLGQRDTGSVGDGFQYLAEGPALVQLNRREDIPSYAASKTMDVLPLGLTEKLGDLSS